MRALSPEDHAALLDLPGIGPYTAAAISSIAFDLRHVVVDGNVERVMARLHDVHTPLPAAKPELTALAEELTPQARTGDYAPSGDGFRGQRFALRKTPPAGSAHGARPCQARMEGTALQLPKKTPKKTKNPIRHGTLYLAQRDDGAWLLENPPRQRAA